ncbi:hypothetical protein DdX_16711 [Ditylenchus destructor]|uniref:Serpentine receptor class gamma n=1 Tax=Ditylenchus destructor TaxID=166010 RepID=A0AAD4MPY1_9BILA|nr:hypothetical protein DdX_16711 [Ditylenchus destructor]
MNQTSTISPSRNGILSLNFGQNLIVLAPLFYGTASFMFDTYVIYTLLRYQNTPFYRLFCWAQMSAWCMWIFGYIVFRGGRCTYFIAIYAALPTSGFLPTILNYGYWYFSYVQWMMYYLLTLNRHLLWYGAVVLTEPYYSLNVDELRSGIQNTSYRFPLLILDAVATITMNLYIAYKLFSQRRQSNNALNSRDTEINLFIFTCFLFASTLVSIVSQTYMFFNIRTMPTSLVTFFSDAQLFALDIHICTASWFLMLLSRPVRENVLGTFSCDCTYSKRVKILARASAVNTNSNARSQSVIRVHSEIT